MRKSLRFGRVPVPVGDTGGESPPRLIEAAETAMPGTPKTRRNVDFGVAIAADLVKKKVPVMTVTNPDKSSGPTAISSQKEDTTRR